MRPRGIGLASVVVAFLLALAVPVSLPRAAAHALLRQSNPGAGAVLLRGPVEIVLTFTEEPEVSLSSVRIVDSSGRTMRAPELETLTGDPRSLRVPLEPLRSGVYTVAWRVLSRVDGHLTSGAFAFGVGVAPPQGDPSQTATTRSSPLHAPSRFLFYAGIGLLLGGAWLWGVLVDATPRSAPIFLAAAWISAVAGVLGLAGAQLADAGVGARALIPTTLGRALAARCVALAAAGIAVLWAIMLRDRRGRAMQVIAVASAAVVVIHVGAGHAGAAQGPARWLAMVFQSAHFVAFGLWIGGLAALLLTLPALTGEARGTAARRYSRSAGIALLLVVLTGSLRAVQEIGAIEFLWSSTFGRILLAKVGFLLGLATLGAINRYRHVPFASIRMTGLRRIGRVELALAAAVLLLTGFLASNAPPSVTGSREATRLAATASDFATSIRMMFEAEPGYPGLNTFVVRIVDYDTRDPIVAERVTLRFTSLDNPDIAASSLRLQEAGRGEYRGQGANLSLQGRWRIVGVIERGVESVEVPLTITTRASPPASIPAPSDQPQIFTFEFTGGRSLQFFVDPSRPGPNQVHLTYFTRDGREVALPAAPQVSASRAGERTVFVVMRFSPGHFIAEGELGPGRWQLVVAAKGPSGEDFTASAEITIRP